MSRNLLYSISNLIARFEQILPQLFGIGRQQPGALALIAVHTQQGSSSTVGAPEFSLKQLLGDGMLWAVPKHRRTVEKRLSRKFGHPEYNWKPLKLKTNLRSCNQCGHDHEAGVLCPHCYDKVRQETKLMQEKIQEELKLDPVEQDVIVLYEGERATEPVEVLNGKHIVEMPKPRPMWFTKNLLQKSTQQSSNNKEVKPSDLG